jgi:hypothetical protein
MILLSSIVVVVALLLLLLLLFCQTEFFSEFRLVVLSMQWSLSVVTVSCVAFQWSTVGHPAGVVQMLDSACLQVMGDQPALGVLLFV